MYRSSFGFHVQRDYVHVDLHENFEISLFAMRRLWNAVISAGVRNSVHRVLVEGKHPTRAMSERDARQHGTLLGGLTALPLRIGFCLYGYRPDTLTELFVANAANHSIDVSFHTDLETAKHWLCAQ